MKSNNGDGEIKTKQNKIWFSWFNFYVFAFFRFYWSLSSNTNGKLSLSVCVYVFGLLIYYLLTYFGSNFILDSWSNWILDLFCFTISKSFSKYYYFFSWFFSFIVLIHNNDFVVCFCLFYRDNKNFFFRKKIIPSHNLHKRTNQNT